MEIEPIDIQSMEILQSTTIFSFENCSSVKCKANIDASSQHIYYFKVASENEAMVSTITQPT